MNQRKDSNTDYLLHFYEQLTARLKSRGDNDYNLTFNERLLIGDTPANLTERYYGNPDLITPLLGQGATNCTHVSGIITADRTNGLGVKGIADRVQIMFVRAAPDGDERDKDVTNAIRYAFTCSILATTRLPYSNKYASSILFI